MNEDLLAEFADLYSVHHDVEQIEGIEIIKEGDWNQEHKSQFRTTIAKYKDVLFAVSESRSGSYHTDWYYDDTCITAVEPFEKVVIEYRRVGKEATIEARDY